MRHIPITRGLSTLVDDADYEWLIKYRWYANADSEGRLSVSSHTQEKGKRTHVKMHRVIMEAQKGQVVDHINHDTLDNRRENLRLCTSSQNSQHRRPWKGKQRHFKGVSWQVEIQKWQTYITANGERIYLGCYSDLREALTLYNREAKLIHGEFAVLNDLTLLDDDDVKRDIEKLKRGSTYGGIKQI